MQVELDVWTLIATDWSTIFSVISSSAMDFSYCLEMVLKTPPLKIPKLRLGVKVVCDANIELMAPTVAAPITTDTKKKRHQYPKLVGSHCKFFHNLPTLKVCTNRKGPKAAKSWPKVWIKFASIGYCLPIN